MRTFSSRKFLMFMIVLVVAVGGWVYALLYKPDQLATVSTFIITLLSAYSGANLMDTHLANQKPQEPNNVNGGAANG